MKHFIGFGIVVSILLAAAIVLPGASTSGETQFPLAGTLSPLDKDALDKAISTARERDVDITEAAALMYYGLLLVQDEEYEESTPYLEESLRRDPSMAPAWEALGWNYIRMEQPDKAERLWNYFQKLMPDHWSPYNVLAQLALLKLDWQKAHENYSEAVKRNPDNFDLRYGYAVNLLRVDKLDEAEKIFRELMVEEPGRLDVQINLAHLLTNTMEYEEATELWRHVNAELPGNPGFLLDLALLELRNGELERADQLCRDALRIDPDNTRALSLRADIAVAPGLSELSVIRLGQVIEEVPDPKVRAWMRVRLATRCKEMNIRSPDLYPAEDILEQYRIAVKESPHDAGILATYMDALLIAKDFAGCKRAAIKILEEFNPNHLRAKMALYEVALAEDRWDDAERFLQARFQDFDPTNPMRHYYEARILVARGMYKDALKRLELLEEAVSAGTVLTLLYHDVTESDWMPGVSLRKLHEHLYALSQAGFSFISPTRIPEVLGQRFGSQAEKSAEPRPGRVPWTARFIDTIRYGITGKRRFQPIDRKAEAPHPMKMVAVTFDDGIKTAFELGGTVAAEIGVPFGMMVLTSTPEDYTPSQASWADVNRYAASGNWVIGSHLHEAHSELPLDEGGTVTAVTLPNRVWNSEKNRPETINEWDRRMRDEFRLSRRIMEKELGDNYPATRMVAYPFGDVGQESYCNLGLMTPSFSILSEAGRQYHIGFIQGTSGYTAAGSNPMQTSRLEPESSDEGVDVVRKAYETHPIFMARVLRFEIAMLMNKSYLAGETLELLRRDGYPEELQRQLIARERSHFRLYPAQDVAPLVTSTLVTGERSGVPPGDSPHKKQPDRETLSEPDALSRVSRAEFEWRMSGQTLYGEQSLTNIYHEPQGLPLVELSAPLLAFEYTDSRANDKLDSRLYSINGGLNLNRNLRLGMDFSRENYKQRIQPRWNAVSRVGRDFINVWTNSLGESLLLSHGVFGPDEHARCTFRSRTDTLRGRLSYLTHQGVSLSASLGIANIDMSYDTEEFSRIELEDEVGSGRFDYERDNSEVVGDFSVQWSPRNSLTLRGFYARDLVPSAVKSYTYDSVGVVVRTRSTDFWQTTVRGQYWRYEDGNGMTVVHGESMIELFPDSDFWLGSDVSVSNSSDPSDYYWTPYWDQRVFGVARLRQSWLGHLLRLDLLYGLQRERERPLRRMEDQYVAGGSEDWDWAYGLSATYNQKLGPTLEFVVDGTVMALRDYIDHRFTLVLMANF